MFSGGPRRRFAAVMRAALLGALCAIALATIAAASAALHTEAPFHIGLNSWYLAANGASTAVLKVRGGVVEELVIAVKRLTQGRKAQRSFLSSFS
jgi:hypothetical protein